MRKGFLATLALVAFAVAGFCQNSSNYSVATPATGSLLADKNGNPIDLSLRANILANNENILVSQLQPIGFEFIFMGKMYTHFMVNHDGNLALGLAGSPNNLINGGQGNILTKTFAYPPTSTAGTVIAPFWDNLRTAATGATVRYTTVGTEPNHCLVIEWNVKINATSTTSTNPADGQFQCRLYEDGTIEFMYGKMTIGPGSGIVTASIGFTAGNTTNKFIAVDNLAALTVTRNQPEEFPTRSLVNTSAPGNISPLHSTNDGSRQKIVFTPNALDGSFTSGSSSNVAARRMTIHWTESSTNKFGYLLYRSDSVDNNYKFISELPTSATSYSVSNLNPDTRYYWKVVAYNEGSKLEKIITDSTVCSMQGTFSIGSGIYPTVKAALDSMTIWGMKGNTIFELSPGYSPSAEPKPISFSGLPACKNNQSTLTVQPAAGSSVNFTTTGNTPVFLITMDHVILEGRTGGTGAPSFILDGTSDLVKVVNGSNNILRYLEIRSNNDGNNAGSIHFEASTVAGTNNNTVTNCEFSNNGGPGFPVNHIFSQSTGGSSNRNNQIINCKLSNFSGYAIHTEGSGWNVTGNSFYASSLVNAPVVAGFIRIHTADTLLQNVISNNFFGGSAPGCAGNVMSFVAPNGFSGVHADGKTSITNNQFRRISIRSGTYLVNPSFADIVRLGPLNSAGSHLVANNQFGGTALEDSISFHSSISTFNKAEVIQSLIGGGSTTISNNSFINIHTFDDGYGLDFIVIGAYNSARHSITNNTIGTNDHLFRIVHKGKGEMVGIKGKGISSIEDNLLTNFTGRKRVTGIWTEGAGIASISRNTISYIKTTEGLTSTNWFSVGGIASFGGTHIIGQNKILSIQDSSYNTSVSPVGILARYGSHQINGNLIDGMMSAPGQLKILKAISLNESSATISNNMVRMGVDSAGSPLVYSGFHVLANDIYSNNLVKHNSFYITGGNVPSSGNFGAYLLYLSGSVLQNNILVNNRTLQNGTDSASYIYLSDPIANSNHNIFYTTTGDFAINSSFQQWQNSGKDLKSPWGLPNFVNPEGPTRTLDLRVQGVTLAEQNGNPLYTTIDDYEGDIRSANTPVDIGADAGNYSRVDFVAPVITVTPLANATDTTSRSVTINITDEVSGIDVSGNNRPRIWYRKSYPAVTPWYSSYGTLVAGTTNNGSWRFDIDHGPLSLSPNGADSVQYYFVAQDQATPAHFVTVSPSAGGVHTDILTQVSAPTNPYRYRVNVAPVRMPLIVNVGLNERYTSLTRDGGLFEAVTRDTISGHTTVRITSHLLENGKWGLDSTFTNGGYSLTIVPSYDSLFVIENETDISAELIRFNNSDKLTIDGSFNGNGRWLQFLNKHTNPSIGKSTFAFFKGCDSVRVLNIEILNNSAAFPDHGHMAIGDGEMKNLLVKNTLFTNIPGNTSRPATGLTLRTSGRLASPVITANHFVNIESTSLLLTGATTRSLIDSNHFYWNDPAAQSANQVYGVYITGTNTYHQLRNNYFGGSAPSCGGTYWLNSGNYNEFIAFKIGSTSDSNTVIENNIVRRIRTTNPAANFFSGIAYFGGNAHVRNNVIGDSTENYSLEIAGSGIRMINSSGRKVLIEGNLIAGIFSTATSNGGLLNGIHISNDSDCLVRKNIVRDFITHSTTTGSTAGTLTGISMASYSYNPVVEENEIFNLTATSSLAVKIAGIQISSAYNKAGTIRSNRIYRLNLPGSENGRISGIYLFQNGSWKVENNQITLINGGQQNAVNIYGIYDKHTHNTINNNYITYNTILIGGSQSSGTAGSYGYMNEGISSVKRFKNNLVINIREGGTGKHGALAIKGSTPQSNWLPGISDYNLFVLKDTINPLLWGSTSHLSMEDWKTTTGGDVNSYRTHSNIVVPTALFMDTAKGNLSIDTNSVLAWYLNGKGIPVAAVDRDYHHDPRSVTVTTGPTDIGSDEFNSGTTAPLLMVYGNHQPGGSDTLSFNDRVVGIIHWGNTGTLPAITARLYTGTWPNDLTNNGKVFGVRSFSSYLEINATGGIGYSYQLTMMYDSSMLGKVQNTVNMMLAKKQSGAAGTWTTLPTSRDAGQKTITSGLLTSFSEFTVTDSSASFNSPELRPDLSVNSLNTASSIGTGTSFPVTYTIKNHGGGPVPIPVTGFYLSADTVLTPGSNGDILLGEHTSTLQVNAGSTSAILSKDLIMQCGLAAGSYYIIARTDAADTLDESEETNNSLYIAVNVVITQTMPDISVNTPAGTVVCSGDAITIALNSTGCTGCSFTWNTGATGDNISVSAAGTYYLIATNNCGADTATQVITAAAKPSKPTITQNGNLLQSSASSGNQWYLNGTAISNATSSTYTPVASGLYTVRVTANGCTSEPSDAVNYSITALYSPVLDASITILTNPVRNILQMRSNRNVTNMKVQLVNINGQLISQIEWKGSLLTVDMEQYAAGLYLIRIIDPRNGDTIDKVVLKL